MTSFRDDFVWGVASSAYQIEGAVDADGRAPSVWDAFCRRGGTVLDGHDGAVACDHYRRYEEDVALIAALGVQAYRFSIAWPRVIPQGVGAVNGKGLDFYDRLVDRLLEKNVTPWVTLFHWDLPLELHHRGGWLNRDSAEWFAAYADVVARRLSDRVTRWITLNEPQCYIGLGHQVGVHAPGVLLDRASVLACIHNTLRAHGMATRALRSAGGPQTQVGWSPVGWVCYPAEDTPEAIEAARAAMFSIAPQTRTWTMNNVWYSDPVVLGRYPEEAERAFGADLPTVFPGDMETIQAPLDFYGVNIYHGAPVTVPVTVDSHAHASRPPRPAGYPQTLMGWTVDPEALYWGPRFLHERYRLPIYVTENGIASLDWVHSDGKVHDPGRIDFLARYLRALHRAHADGVDVRGYFQWSIMDNFEWELGYTKRFGLTYVDYASQERIPKDSYYWYQQVVKENGGALWKGTAPLR